MPSAILGSVHIDSMDGGSVVEFGDCLSIEPQNTSKIYAGSGSFSAGDFHIQHNIGSITKSFDPDVIDTSNVANQ